MNEDRPNLNEGELLVNTNPLGEPNYQAVSAKEVILTENVGFVAVDREIIKSFDAVVNGNRRQREQEQRRLIDRVRTGTTNDLLDATNAVVVSIGMVSSPVARSGVYSHVGVQAPRTTEALRNTRDFMGALLEVLARDAKSYPIDPDKPSNLIKLQVAAQVLDDLKGPRRGADRIFSDPRVNELGVKLHMLNELMTQNRIDGRVFIMGPELSPSEHNEILEISKKDPRDISQKDLGLLIKGSAAWGQLSDYDRPDTSLDTLANFFREGAKYPAMHARVLQNLNASLESPDVAVRNCAQRILFQIAGNTEPAKNMLFAQMSYFREIQGYIKRLAAGDNTVDPQITEQIDRMVAITAPLPATTTNPDFLAVNFNGLLLRVEGRLINEPPFYDRELIKTLESSQVDNPSLGLILRYVREREANNISEDAFLELFDERRPLGFFLDNLVVYGLDLQRITREDMWPSFIAGRRSKIWPSERELDILAFSTGHPAEVLGFSGIEFFTRGFTPPEVGLVFTLKQGDRVLTGQLDQDGRLIGLPFDLESTHPLIHAFLENVAVGSFEELVTVAEKRIKVRNAEPSSNTAGSRQERTSSEEDSSAQLPLPRKETTYITFSNHNPNEIQSDEVIEDARERERLPRLIPQRVVPLAYAQQYRYFRNQLEQARTEGAAPEVIRTLEGQMLLALSLVRKPSGMKLENLPEQFQLEKTFDGKYLDTWRKEHIRPKPKDGEDVDLSVIFERRFRAVPISLTKHLETWFTQPPIQKA